MQDHSRVPESRDWSRNSKEPLADDARSCFYSKQNAAVQWVKSLSSSSCGSARMWWDCEEHVGIPRLLPTAALSTEAWQTCANPQKLPAVTNTGGRGSSKRHRTDTARTLLSSFSRTSMKRRLWNRVSPSCGHGETR